MNPEKHFPHEFLLRLIEKRSQGDLGGFMEELYNGLASSPAKEYLLTEIYTIDPDILNTMMKHFLQKEEYEKCEQIKGLLARE